MKHPIINLIKQSSSIYLQRSFGQLLMFAFMFITLTPVQAAIDGFAQETMEPMIKLELGYTPALCRQPSRFPDNVNQGQLELGCRQMKAVQHWLNLLTNPETLYGSAQQVEGDGIENRHFEIDDYRRQYYFGRYWETFQRNNRRVNDDDCDLVCVSYALYGTPGVVQDAFDNHPNPVELYHPTAVDPIMEDFDEKYDNNYSQWLSLLQLPQFPKQTGSYGFDQVLRETFQRMYAILIASAYPVDRRESSLVSGEWWWELPPYYRDLCTDDLSLSQCLHLRARIMREDVNAWIQNAGIWVYASMGTGSKTWLTKQIYDETGIAPKGGYDFVAIEILNFMYALKDKPSLLFDESIIPLVKKRVDESHSLAMVQQQRIEWAGIDDWDDTIIAFAGPFNSDVLTFRQYVALTNIAFSETENHALIAFAHNYLMNQWILNDYRNNLADQITLPEGFDITSYFSVTGNDVERWTRDALGRVVHNDLFETNALPYQRVSMHPILLLASFSENHTIKTEAENAMHFLATKFSFQSFEGRKSAPMRRNCQYAHELAFYARDAAAYAFGILSGAYKWNDSPYGMRWGTNNPATCLNQPRAQSCYWPHYSWKKEINPDTTVVPTASGEHIFTDEAGFNRYKPGSISSALWFGFGHYRIPPAVHDFMLHKYKGYYARMMAKYDRGAPKESHYRYSTGEPSSNDYPQYFNGDQAYDTALNNERTPEFYFAGQGFLNSSGGVYNPYYTFASNSKEEGYKIPRNPHQTVKSAGCNGNANGEKLENYDFLSRPTLILPQIEYQDIIDDVKFGTVTRVYKPVGLDVNRPAAYLQQFIPMMLGNKENWFKSSNVAVYKNFGYGYKISGRNTSPISSAEYRYIGGESPIDIPEQWKPCLAEKNEIVFGLPKSCDSLIRTYSFDYGTTLFDKKAAHFKLYDLREYLQNKGQTGFYLITASLEKRAGAIHHWSSKVARGFWEVVPMDKAADLDELRALIEAGNNPDDFSRRWSRKEHKHYRYRLVTSGELISLSQYYGALWNNYLTFNEGRVQGIIGVSTNGINNSLANVYLRFMENGNMNRLPLMDVKEVDENYNFKLDANDQYVYNACARDGWLFVNNTVNNTYLWVDSRRGANFEQNGDTSAPYWEAGYFSDDTPWAAQCGFGGSGGWVPSPPDNGQPESCSQLDGCPTDRPGGREPPPQQCDPAVQDCPERDCPFGHCIAPDLTPMKGLVNPSTGMATSYCTEDGTNQLKIRIENIGNADALPSLASVTFNGLEPLSFAVELLPPGNSKLLSVDIPPGCFDDVCSFEITADATSTIFEQNEANNDDTGVCFQPG